MQYDISINQKAFSEVAPNCDLIDATIFDFIRKSISTGQIRKKEENEEIWFWVSHKKVIRELPMLNIKSRTGIYNRLENLIDAGLIKRCPTNQKQAKSYFGQGENFNKLQLF